MTYFLCLYFLLPILGSPALGSPNQNIVNEVQEALRNLTQGPESFRPDVLSEEALASLQSITNLNMFPGRPKTMVWPHYTVDCAACEAAVSLVLYMFQSGTPLWEVEVALSSLCIVLHIEAAEVCDGMVHNYGYQVEYIVNNLGERATPQLVCGVFIGGDCGDQETINDWTIDIPPLPEVPPTVTPGSPMIADSSTIRVLQIADVHLSRTYLPGSLSVCEEPLCCMESTGMAGEGEPSARYWGDYHCDLPIHTFENMMEHIAHTHSDIDYVIFTGDSPAHDVWLQTKEANLANQILVLDTIQTFLPEVPVLLCLGNHEGFPVNSFPTGDLVDSVVSGDWLYGGLAVEPWADNLEEEARVSFRENGFYSTLVRPGLRIIALNNNFCVGMNFFLMLDFSDPGDQLSWLVHQLLQSEANGESVHILSHHNPRSCLPGWAREYTRIVNRFQSVVKAQFHGHTHDDWFLVFHNQTGSPSSTAFIAPSVTPWYDNNPEYRIYSVAGNQEQDNFGFVMDHDTWSMDLSELVSENDSPRWRKLYSAIDDLGLTGITPAHWKDVLRTALTDDGLFERMARYFHQDREGQLPDRRRFLCDMIWNKECDL